MNRKYYDYNSDDIMIETESFLICDQSYLNPPFIAICKKSEVDFSSWMQAINIEHIPLLREQIISRNPDFNVIESYCLKIMRLKAFL